MPTAVITATEVKEIKSGTNAKTKKPWTLFRVVDASGTEFSTFDAAWREKIGQAQPIEYTEEQVPGKDGNFYKRRTILEPKREKANGQETFQALYLFGQIEKRLASIEAKIDVLIEYYNTPAGEARVPF